MAGRLAGDAGVDGPDAGVSMGATSAGPAARRPLRAVLWCAVASSVAMLAWMGRSLLAGTIPLTGDLLHWNYPIRDFFATALAGGHAPWWMPSIYAGFPIAAEGQLGVLHPARWLLYLVLPLDRAFAVELVAPYVFASVGVWVFLRRMCGDGAAAGGALLFASSGFMLSHGVHMNMVAVVAHIPWLLRLSDLAIDGDSLRVRRSACAGVVLVTGSAILSGHPQAVWFALLIVGSYTITRAYGSGRQAASGLMLVGTAALLGLAVGAPQIAATLDAAQHSARPVGDAVFADTFSLPFVHALQLVEPYAFWGRVLRWNEVAPAADELAMYGGAVPLVLTAWWLQSGRSGISAGAGAGVATDAAARLTGRIAWWALGLALCGLWLAFGRRAGLYALQEWLPFVSQFRAPARFILFTHLGLAIVAAVALWRLGHVSSSSGSRRVVVAPWLVAGVSVAGAIWMAAAPELVSSATPWWVFAAGPVAFIVAALLVTMAARGWRPALAGLVLLAALDQGLYGLGGVVAWQDFITRPEAEALLDTRGLNVPTTEGRLARGGFPNLYVLAGYQLLDGYAGLTPSRQLDYRLPNALRAAGVAFVHRDFLDATTPSVAGFNVARPSDAMLTDAEPVGRGWMRLTTPLPRVRLVDDVRVSQVPAVDIARIDVSRTALVDGPVPVDAGEPGVIRMDVDVPGRVDVVTEASGRRLLVVTESFDPGWQAMVDNVPTGVVRTNGDFLGVPVPAGRHAVRVEYRLPGLAVWGMVSLTALTATLLLSAWGLLRAGASRP